MLFDRWSQFPFPLIQFQQLRLHKTDGSIVERKWLEDTPSAIISDCNGRIHLFRTHSMLKIVKEMIQPGRLRPEALPDTISFEDFEGMDRAVFMGFYSFPDEYRIVMALRVTEEDIPGSSMFIRILGRPEEQRGQAVPQSTGFREEKPSPRADNSGFHAQAYPNPFNDAAQLHVHLPEATFLKADIYNILGEVVESVTWHNLTPGQHVLPLLNTTNLSGSGTCMVRITTSTHRQWITVRHIK